MAGHNRHLRGNTQQIKGTVRSNTTVEPGDFVVLNNQDGTCGNTSTTLNQADNYFYPFTSTKTVTAASEHEDIIATQFVGVAMTGSASGTTNEIVVAVDGIYRYPILKGPSAVTIGAKVSAVSAGYSGTAASTGTSTQIVANHATQAGNGSTAYLGYIVKTESGASFVDFQLWSGIYDGQLT